MQQVSVNVKSFVFSKAFIASSKLEGEKEESKSLGWVPSHHLSNHWEGLAMSWNRDLKFSINFSPLYKLSLTGDRNFVPLS